MSNRKVTAGAQDEEDKKFEASLRPRRLADFTGQPKLKENLAIAIEAARQRGDAEQREQRRRSADDRQPEDLKGQFWVKHGVSLEWLV